MIAMLSILFQHYFTKLWSAVLIGGTEAELPAPSTGYPGGIRELSVGLLIPLLARVSCLEYIIHYLVPHPAD